MSAAERAEWSPNRQTWPTRRVGCLEIVEPARTFRNRVEVDITITL
jgi:hypothetical protein